MTGSLPILPFLVVISKGAPRSLGLAMHQARAIFIALPPPGVAS